MDYNGCLQKLFGIDFRMYAKNDQGVGGSLREFPCNNTNIVCQTIIVMQ